MTIYKYPSNYPNSPKGEVVPFRKSIDVSAIVVWAYSREKVHFTPGTVGPSASGWDSVARVERIGTLGGFVDSSMSMGSTVHADAEAVHETVLRLGYPWTGILIEHGKSSLVPDWMPKPRPLIYRPVLSRRGTAVMIRDHNRHAIACEVEVTGDDPKRVVHQRTVYGMWWAALDQLSRALVSVRLASHQVTGPIADREPWVASLDTAQKR